MSSVVCGVWCVVCGVGVGVGDLIQGRGIQACF